MLLKLFLFLSFATSVHCQANVWRSITPLKSTRVDVEKILGKPDPTSQGDFAATYTTRWGRVFVLYSTGACSIKPSNGWNIPEMTVISVSVYPEPEPDFNESQFTLKDFVKHPDPEILSSVVYTNAKQGVSIAVNSWDHFVTR